MTKIYSGDTIEAEGHDISIIVRLTGIDAPEIPDKEWEFGQPYSRQAKNYLAVWILNEAVDIKGYGLDEDNRIWGVIHLRGVDINLEMIRSGLAEVYRGGSPQGLDLTMYLKEEKQARQEKRGMWSLGDNYVSPLEWHKNRGETVKGFD